jgi:uncharacterized protein YegL
MNEQKPFDAVSAKEFADNPEQRCPCVLLLDVSGSMGEMGGKPIAALNNALAAFRDSLLADSLAAKRVEVAIVTFGEQVQTVTDFTTPDGFSPPTLTAGGLTPMGAAMNQGMDMLQRRKEAYLTNGIKYYRPWIFLITDGEPTDEAVCQAAADRIKQAEATKSIAFFVVGVLGANFDKLEKIAAGRKPLKLDELQFRKLFEWLSSSLQRVSSSTPGDDVPLSNPAGPNGWAVV